MIMIPGRTAVVDHPGESIVNWDVLAPSYGSGIVFDPVPHRYMADGKLIPSVTQILEAVGYINARFYRPGSAQRGRDVHKLTAWVDTAVIEAGDVMHHQWAKYLIAYEAWKHTYAVKVGAVEQLVADPKRQWAGTLDRLAAIGRDPDGELAWDAAQVALVDIKTGAPEKWHAIQLCAYQAALERSMLAAAPKIRRFGLYLRPDATYRFQEYPEDHTQTWLDAVAQYWAAYQSMADN